VEQDDAALVALARERRDQLDPAFRELFSRHKDPIFAFLVRLLRDRELAEDVLQESFFRVFLNLDRFSPARSSFRTWLYQIARHTAIDMLRSKEKRERLFAEKAAESSPPEDEDSAVKAEQSTRAQRALETLPEETRALLIARHGLGMKLDELAASWSVNERTIRSRLLRAAESLARALLLERGGP
jgi:RNA polymerase sigma-70 factor (ECF subfamily)